MDKLRSFVCGDSQCSFRWLRETNQLNFKQVTEGLILNVTSWRSLSECIEKSLLVIDPSTHVDLYEIHYWFWDMSFPERASEFGRAFRNQLLRAGWNNAALLCSFRLVLDKGSLCYVKAQVLCNLLTFYMYISVLLDCLHGSCSSQMGERKLWNPTSTCLGALFVSLSLFLCVSLCLFLSVSCAHTYTDTHTPSIPHKEEKKTPPSKSVLFCKRFLKSKRKKNIFQGNQLTFHSLFSQYMI